MKKILSVIVAANLFAMSVVRSGYSAFSKDDAGTATAQFLKLGAGARATGMGDVFAGISDDATAVYWNPAGLNQVEKKSVSAMHAIWFEDIFYDWVSYVHPVESIGTFGIGVQYLSYGEIQETDETGLEGSNFKPNDLAVTISYARKISDFSAGINIKYISSKIKESAAAFAVDIGGMYDKIRIQDKRLQIGLVIQNIGTKMQFVDEADPLPVNIKLGGAYNIKDNWLVALDVNAPVYSVITVGIGTEYNYKINDNINIAGRVGYNTRTKDIDGLQGLTAGLGASYLSYDFDYSFVPFGDLGNTHRVSIGIKF